MRAHPAEIAAYGAPKADLARRFGGDRDGYTGAKTAFVRDLLARAAADDPA